MASPLSASRKGVVARVVEDALGLDLEDVVPVGVGEGELLFHLEQLLLGPEDQLVVPVVHLVLVAQ